MAVKLYFLKKKLPDTAEVKIDGKKYWVAEVWIDVANSEEESDVYDIKELKKYAVGEYVVF